MHRVTLSKCFSIFISRKNRSGPSEARMAEVFPLTPNRRRRPTGRLIPGLGRWTWPVRTGCHPPRTRRCQLVCRFDVRIRFLQRLAKALAHRGSVLVCELPQFGLHRCTRPFFSKIMVHHEGITANRIWEAACAREKTSIRLRTAQFCPSERQTLSDAQTLPELQAGRR